MDVNVTAPFEFIRAAVPAMKAAKWGRIVNIASTAALQGYRYTAAYCASKHAILGLSRGVALDVARAGITVNAVCPGFTDTDMATRAIDNISAKTGRDAETARAELERLNPRGASSPPTRSRRWSPISAQTRPRASTDRPSPSTAARPPDPHAPASPRPPRAVASLRLSPAPLSSSQAPPSTRPSRRRAVAPSRRRAVVPWRKLDDSELILNCARTGEPANISR